MIMEKEIRSKHNVISVAALVIAVFICIGYVVRLFNGTSTAIGRELILLIGVVLILSTLVNTISTSIVVHAEGIQIKKFGASKFYSWTEFDTLSLLPTFFGAYNVALRMKEGKTIAPFIGAMGNNKELNKSIIEASVKANPDIKLDNLAIEAFGPPPFGYFD